MTTAPVTDALAPAQPGRHEAADPVVPPVRMVLTGYARTLLVPLAALAALLSAWTLTAASGWPTATAAAAGWALLAGAWLRRCGWSPVRRHALTWAAPLAVLTPLIAAGWLSADGLVLWGPAAALCAVALALTHRPMTVVRPDRGACDRT